ncbi:hypothetical protein PUNSTDRAFT_72638, partial [Punctularia strigosozonata HHB-11173 SS5]|uniref:uncharacterized protein n=1 Tax=Punctularia strigosozonata (strain HHB-11173) TaxID=741275 RepID=UPI0004416481
MYALTAAIFSLFALASASPAKRATAEITYPHAATTWIIGHHHNVTWYAYIRVDTSSTGDIFLAKGGVIDPTALITGVSVSSGRTIIVVPFVNPDTDYAVVANFSGQNPNFSDQFAI